MNKEHLNFLRNAGISKHFCEELLGGYSKAIEAKIKSLSKDSEENLDLILILKRFKRKRRGV